MKLFSPQKIKDKFPSSTYSILFLKRRMSLFILLFMFSLNLSAQESNCSDGIDNDNDGFVDCADTDCDLLANCPLPTDCSALEGNIHFGNSGNNTNPGYTTQYLLTDTANVIQQVSNDTFFTNVSAGVFVIYVLNYETSGGINNNMVGDTLKNISGGCFIVEAGTPIRVCAAPNAVNDIISTNEDIPITINVLSNDTDADSPLLGDSVSIITNPTQGIVTNPITSDSTLTYIPNANFNGLDSIQYEICDASTANKLCDSAWIYITINPVNDPPVVDNEMHTTPEDTPVGGDLTDAGDSDPDGTALTANTTPIDDANNGTITIAPDGSYTYTPDLNFNGLDTVVVEICDAGTPTPIACVNDTIFITITPVNDPPVVDNEILTTPEETPISGDLTDAGDSDPDGTALTANTTPIDDADKGTITIAPDGSYTYTPDLNINGQDTVVVEICDAGTPTPNACVNDTIFITITPVNDPPVVDNEMHTTPEDTPVSGDLTDAGDSDPEGAFLIITTPPIDDANNGTITIAPDGSYTYTPDPNFNGQDTVVVEICETLMGAQLISLCANDTIFITVTPVNDPPILDNETHTTNEDTPVSGDLTDAGDVDPEGTALTATTTPIDDANNGTIVINPDGSYTYTPNPNFNGLDTVVVEICDAGGSSDPVTPTPNACANDTIFITVIPDILVEFTDTIASDLESSGMNLPTLTISGGILDVPSTIEIVLNASPGTATAGTDYLPDFASTLTVNIPAGDYSTPQTIPLSSILSITDDTAYEGNEFFSIDLSNPQGSSNQLTIGDADGNGNTENNHIYTIIEDDCAPSGGTITIIGNR